MVPLGEAGCYSATTIWLPRKWCHLRISPSFIRAHLSFLPQAPRDDLKILVSMTDDKSRWKDFSSEGTGFCFVSMQSRCWSSFLSDSDVTVEPSPESSVPHLAFAVHRRQTRASSQKKNEKFSRFIAARCQCKLVRCTPNFSHFHYSHLNIVHWPEVFIMFFWKESFTNRLLLSISCVSAIKSI